MSGRLEDWARARAPSLLKQAEAEAVALLRERLLDAVVAEARQPAPPPGTSTRIEQARPAASEPTRAAREAVGHGLWAYCVGRGDGMHAVSAPGVDPEAPVQRVEHQGLVALVSRVPLADFNEEALQANLNDLSWLERTARAHEAVLEAALAHGPIVPLRLCTIYESEARLRETLAREQEAFADALDRLDGRQEWGVKLTVDREALEAAARRSSPDVAALEDEVASRSGGGAYMLGRRLERSMAEVTAQLATDLAADVHARLSDWARDSVFNPVQNPELSGHEGTMLLNGAYLVDSERASELGTLLAELEDHYRDLGASLELTGPWPPYNFVSRDAESSL